MEKNNGLEREMTIIRGKEVLIKVVAQTILTYSMSYFKIPTTLCTKLGNMMT